MVYTYDEIGNPLSDGTSTYTWEHGRQLATQIKNGVEWTYTYDANGMRTSRTSDTKSYSYVYSGDKLVQMTITDHTTTPETVSVVEYAYDAAGQPMTMTLGEDVYYYVLNLQGDVTGIVDSSGTLMITYYYEGYGKCFYLSDTSDKTATMSANNHLLYRGYVVDKGTGLYYLQSRYYDPNVGRFLNADGLVSTGQGLLGNNMFAYCLNNPINFMDSDGFRAVLNTRGCGISIDEQKFDSDGQGKSDELLEECKDYFVKYHEYPDFKIQVVNNGRRFKKTDYSLSQAEFLLKEAVGLIPAVGTLLDIGWTIQDFVTIDDVDTFPDGYYDTYTIYVTWSETYYWEQTQSTGYTYTKASHVFVCCWNTIGAAEPFWSPYMGIDQSYSMNVYT